MDFIYYYITIGFILNLGVSLITLYRGEKEGYLLLPHPMYFFLTMFSWPKTLWNIITNLTGKKDES